MTITQWEYALAVDKFRHFGKAAKHCSVAQPTLSMQLQKLEDELGVVIFDRSKNPILPTSEGEALLGQARVMIREYKRIPEMIRQFGDKVAGTLKVAIIPTMTPYLAPLFIKNFAKQYPLVELIIQEHTTEDILSLLDHDEIDVACMATPLKDDRFIERVLFYEPFSLYVSPEHPLHQKDEVYESELEVEDLWLLTEGHCFRNQVLRFCQIDSSVLKHHNLYFESGHLETLKNMVDNVGGYTLLPKLGVDQLSLQDKKNIREFSGEVPTREVSLVHSRSFLKEKMIMALQDVILASVPKELKTYKGKVLEIY